MSTEFRELLYQLLAAMIPILVAFLSGVAGLLMIEARRLLAERVGQARARSIEHYVRLGVYAAEQYLRTEDGQSKKAWVIKWVEAQLALRGIPAPAGFVSEVIEAIVAQEKLELAFVHEIADDGALDLTHQPNPLGA